MNERSPWWYRQRGLVIGMIFIAGFFLGNLIWGLTGEAPEAFFEWAGASLGAFGPHVVLLIATLLVAAGWAIRLWGSSYLSARVVWNPDAKTHALLVDGPFRFVRNPLYLGNALFATGIATLAPPLGFAIIVLGHAVFLPMLMRCEADALRAQYGAIYDAYEKAVPAFIARLTPARVNGSVTGEPSLAQGMRSEIFSLCLVFGMLGIWFAGPYSQPLFYTLWVGGWIVQRLVTPPLPASA